MNKRQVYILFVLAGFFVSLWPGHSVQANEELNFSVKAILPEDQRDNTHSYFDLRVSPGERRVLQVEVTNDTDEDMVVAASANSAITNDNGVVDYSHQEVKKEASVKVIFSEIASMPKETKVPKKSKVIIECVITLPAEVFNGYVLGGLYFEQKLTGSANKEASEAVTVKNSYSYVIGVLLSETDIAVPAELQLNDVKATQLNLNNAVIMNIQNTTAAMIPQLTVDAKLYYENETQPRYENHQDTIKMAPNTSFNYRIELKEQPFVAGDYRVEVTASTGTREWSWTKAFNIEEAEAKKYNKTAVNLPPTPKAEIPWVLLIIIGLLFLLLVGTVIYHIRQKNRTKTE